jgi:hypothetical protein
MVELLTSVIYCTGLVDNNDVCETNQCDILLFSVCNGAVIKRYFANKFACI